MKLRIAFALLAAAPAVASAQAIVRPTSAVINSGGPGFGSIADTHNGNGLSTNFVSGVTDFDAYIAANPTHSFVFSGNEWFSELNTTSATVTYDLGAILSIDRFALWNEEVSGIGQFNLLGSTNGTTFSALLTGISPVDIPSGNYRRRCSASPRRRPGTCGSRRSAARSRCPATSRRARSARWRSARRRR
jgi:hypothetical protein